MLRFPTIQIAFDGTHVEKTRYRFEHGEYARLREMAEGHRRACEFHYPHLSPEMPGVVYVRPDRRERILARRESGLKTRDEYDEPIFLYEYYDPWQKKDEAPKYFDTICRWCEERGLIREGDFSPEYCDRCDREVIQRNPANGWRSYFKSDIEDPDDALCCVGCFQDYVFENGIPRERFVEGRVMCDWYDWGELGRRGFEELSRHYGSDISKDPHAFGSEMLKLIDSGYKLAIDQGPTGIGNGYPDWVDVWGKREEDEHA